MYNEKFENLKKALRRKEEENYAKLREEVKKVRATIEKILTMILESSASVAKTNYSGLEMY
jgi:hypothetical protein